MAERAFEAIIQQRFQTLEDELRSGLNIRDTIQKSCSQVIKAWQEQRQQEGDLITGSQILTQGSNQLRLEDMPTMAEDDIGNCTQPVPDLSDLEIPGPPLIISNTPPEANNNSSDSDTLSMGYPCFCHNLPFDFFQFSSAEEFLSSDPSQSARSSGGSLAIADSLSNTFTSRQDYTEPIIPTDHKGRRKAPPDDTEAVVPSLICHNCFGHP